ncbi:uncharacterized protein [Ptychodera flava]|uniref:uncharacterized protein n=1 Tax=Ptychodera flava TaxID=63121 RepID=UPI00396A6493
MTAAVKVSDGTKCAAYNHLCIKVSWGTKDTSQCVTPIATNCDFIAFKAGSFEITSPATYTFNRVVATAITFKAGFVNDQATPTTVTSTKLYLSDKDDLDATDAKVSDAIDVKDGPASVPANANGETTGVTSGMTASVQILKADNCAHYDKLCIKVVPGNSVICIALTSKDCSAMAFKDRTFTITAPATYKLNRTKATTLTFNAALVSIQATEVTLTSYKLYLSDNTDLSATGAKLSKPIDVTDAPTKVPANADGSSADKGLTNGMTAAVKIESADDCSAYKWACLKAEPGPATGCVDVTGKTGCTDSGGDFQKLSLSAVLLILVSIMLQSMG